MTAFVPLGNTVSVSASPTVTVSNIAVATNTFRVINANATGYSYVGVYPTYAQALTADHPVGSGSGFAVAIAPQQSEIIVGNFGVNANTSTVYVSTITAISSGQVVQITPVKI